MVCNINWTFANILQHSPADQAILEAEYKQNPKPNKAARADIVEKVSLNEKEVQVRILVRDAILGTPGASYMCVPETDDFPDMVSE